MSFDDQHIYSELIPDLILLRTLSLPRWTIVEQRMPHARPGVKTLVHRHRQSYFGQDVIVDYITVRAPVETRYGQWYHITAAYLPGEEHPFPYQYNAAHLQVAC